MRVLILMCFNLTDISLEYDNNSVKIHKFISSRDKVKDSEKHLKKQDKKILNLLVILVLNAN